MQKSLVKNKSVNAFLWNTIGSVIYSGSSFVLLLLVTHNVDEQQAGIYSIAFAVAQLMLSIGRYGMRPFQSTDIHEKYCFEEYVVSRTITCFLMMVGSGVYGLAFSFDSYKFQVLIWLCALKMVDAIEDIFHGYMQQHENLGMAGKMLVLRNTFTMLIFGVSIVVSKDVLIASRFTTIFSILLAFGINIATLGYRINFKNTVRWKKVIELLKECFGLFIAMFLVQYIYNAPKVALDTHMPIEYQTYYGILFMISFVLSIFSELLFRPLLTGMARKWEEGQYKALVKTIMGMLGFIAVLGIILEILGAKWILRILSVVYGIGLEEYIVEFRILMLGGIVSAATYFLYNVWTAIRCNRVILWSYATSALVSTIIPYILTKRWGMLGACLSYTVSMVVVFSGLLIGGIHHFRKRKL